MAIRVNRTHEISCGHRICGHENKCAKLHGHCYYMHFACEAAALDKLGRVIDFSVIKARLCQWLEDNWDHRFLVWEHDPWRAALEAIDADSIVAVPFNPTAELMAEHLVDVVGPAQLDGTGVTLVACTVEETRKCSATYCR